MHCHRQDHEPAQPLELELVVGDHCFDDLDYADDALLVVDSNEQVLPVLKMFEEMAETVGMHPSWPKTKIQILGRLPRQVRAVFSRSTCVVRGNSCVYPGMTLSPTLTSLLPGDWTTYVQSSV